MTTHPIKTRDEMAAEADRLVAMKPKVRRTSMFGDDHHAGIDAQVEVLREDLSEDAIYDRWGDGDNEDSSALDNALEARQWADGKSKTAPSSEWKELVRT